MCEGYLLEGFSHHQQLSHINTRALASEVTRVTLEVESQGKLDAHVLEM